MQLSKQEIDPELDDAIRKRLYQVLASIRTADEIEILLGDLLTQAELVALSKRLAIVSGLEEKQSYESIRDTLKVSSATIASMQDRLKNGSGGLQLALERLEEDELAESLMTRIRKLWK